MLLSRGPYIKIQYSFVLFQFRTAEAMQEDDVAMQPQLGCGMPNTPPASAHEAGHSHASTFSFPSPFQPFPLQDASLLQSLSSEIYLLSLSLLYMPT